MTETGQLQRRSQSEEEKKEPVQAYSSEQTVALSSHDVISTTPGRMSCKGFSDADSLPLSVASTPSGLTAVRSLFPEEGEEEGPLSWEEREQRLVKELVMHILSRAEETVRMDTRRKGQSESNSNGDEGTGDKSFEVASPGFDENGRTEDSCTQNSSSSMSTAEQDSEKSDAGQAKMFSSLAFNQLFSDLVSRVKLNHTPHFTLDNYQQLARSKVSHACAP